MKNFILSIILLLAIPSVLTAQEYIPYNKIFENKVEDTWNDDIYYILISASWCDPCQVLKAKLKKYPDIKIYALDYSDTSAVNGLKPKDRGIPYFLRVEVVEGKSTKYVYNTNQDLKYFIKYPAKAKEPEFVEQDKVAKPIEPDSKYEEDVEPVKPDEEEVLAESTKPVEEVEDEGYTLEPDRLPPSTFGGIFDRLEDRLNKLEENTEKKLENLRKERETVFDLKPLFARFSDVFTKFSEATEERRTILDFVRELKESWVKAGEERQGILSQLSEIREERIELRKERESLFSKFAEAAKERAEASRERAAAAREAIAAARERSELGKRWADQDRKFTPLLNLTDRFNNFVEALTSSVWKLLGLIISVIIILVVVLGIVLWILSMLQKLGTKLLIKAGLKSLV